MLSKYSYFFCNVIGLFIVIAFYLVARKHRKMMLLSGLTLIPFSAFSVLHEVKYWNPVRLNGWGWGIEDIMCCFSVGSFVWLFAIYPFRTRYAVNIKSPFFLRRIFSLSVILYLFFIVCSKYLSVMSATILVQLSAAIMILLLRPKLLLMGISAALNYTIYYAGILHLYSLFVPDFFKIWNGYEIWGHRISGMPLEEIMWAFTAAMGWSLIIGFAAETKISN